MLSEVSGSENSVEGTMSDQPLTPTSVILPCEPDQFRNFISGLLVLLCHKFFCRDRLPIGAAQHGHRDRVVASAKINLLRIVAIEFGTWRSVRSGGASRS